MIVVTSLRRATERQNENAEFIAQVTELVRAAQHVIYGELGSAAKLRAATEALTGIEYGSVTR